MDSLLYGPDGPSESYLRLLGDGRGKRVVELGCGTGASSIALARSGAVVICIDASADKLAGARRLAEKEGVRLETRRAEPGSMPFLAADSVDAVLSIYSLGHPEEADRVFRQAQRVLRPGAALIVSVAHPVRLMLDGSDDEPDESSGLTYFDEGGQREARERRYRHTVESLFSALCRSGHRVDALLEPRPRGGGAATTSKIPQTLILRARKMGA